MKIAILTWFNNDANCGQTLQAYALQKKITLEGIECILINYITAAQKYKYPLLWSIYRFLSSVKYHRLIRQIKFKVFIRKYLDISPVLFSLKAVEDYLSNNDIKYLLLGSDQIWNPEAGIEEVYMLNFNGNFIKCAYSPSMCATEIAAKYEEEINNLAKSLQDYSFIGVRESTSQGLLSKYCQKDIRVLLDPVFLINAKEWKDFLRLNIYSKKYLLLIIYGEFYQKMMEYINRIKVKGHYSFVICITRGEAKIPDSTFVVKRNVAPRDFVSYIMNADFIFTDSFHTVCFSIIFRKNFYAICSRRKDFDSGMNRITDLLQRIELHDRYIEENGTDNDLELEIDYRKHERNIEEKIIESKNNLKQIIMCFEGDNL